MTTVVFMKLVSINQLKAWLSEYVRLARSGELILVSDRDEVVAELGPLRHQPPPADSIDATLDRLAREGQLTRAADSKRGWSWSPRALGLSGRRVSDILDDLRQDR